MNVKDIMTREVRTCAPDTSLANVAKIMADQDCGSLPVVDADGRVVSMVTDRDIAIGAGRADQALSKMAVRDVMSKTLHSCRPDMPIELASQKMADFRVRRLPVVDGTGTLIGLLTLARIAREAAKGSAFTKVTVEAVGTTLASVSQRPAVVRGVSR